MEVQAAAGASSSFVAVKDEAFAAAAAGRAAKAGLPMPAVPGQSVPQVGAEATAPPRVKGPPPKPPVKLETQAQAAPKAGGEPPLTSAAPGSTASEDQSEIMERRLTILTKIMERTGPSQEELKEIMRVPEVMRAMTMQRQGAKTEAMAVLAEYKAELEKSVVASRQAGQVADPRRPADLKPSDPRAVDPRQSTDPRQDPRQLEKSEVRPQDPRQAARQVTDAKQLEASTGKRTADAQLADPRQKQAKVAKSNSQQAAIMIDDDEDEAADVEVVDPLAGARQILQGLPSLGFSEDWLRQFLEQMPVREPTAPQAGSQRKKEACVGRKVLGAEGEQMVYVDELSPSEILLLMQLVFLLEERLKASGGGPGGSLDITQRIPHTFSYLQMDGAIDVMLKRLFDELPHQCAQTGLRFASREKLRKHNDALYRRRAAQTQRQRGAEARGWMETIPEWVGNRDIVVGPALFQLGGGAAIDEANAQRAQRASALEDAVGMDEEEDEASERNRWICPLDERRSVCPISGEPFEREWSQALNDWAFSDVVAMELGTTDQVLRFPPKNPKDPERLSESAFLFKKSCFLNTSPAQRLAALEDCRTAHALGREEDKPKAPVQESSDAAKGETEKLAASLAEAAAVPRRKFF